MADNCADLDTGIEQNFEIIFLDWTEDIFPGWGKL